MAGLDPAIHASAWLRRDVDARGKPGHDDGVFGSRLSHVPYRSQRLDHPSDFRRLARLAEIESLHRGAAAFADEVELVRGLDAFRGGLDAEHRAEACDGADDRHALRAFAERADEGAIDLDAVEGKFP